MRILLKIGIKNGKNDLKSEKQTKPRKKRSRGRKEEGTPSFLFVRGKIFVYWFDEKKNVSTFFDTFHTAFHGVSRRFTGALPFEK